jgi:hypothetical protein
MAAEHPSTPVMPKRDLHEACEKLQENARQTAMNAGVNVVSHLVEADDTESVVKSISETGAEPNSRGGALKKERASISPPDR